MELQVPDDFSEDSCIHTKNKWISITKYVEHAPSKIYTKVNETLLVLVLKGEKRLIYKDFALTISQGEFGIFRKGNYIMNQIIDRGEYKSLLIFISDELLQSLPKLSLVQESEPMLSCYKGNIVPHMHEEASLLLKLIEDEDREYDEILHLKVKELLLYILIEDKSKGFTQFIRSLSEPPYFKSFMEGHYDDLENLSVLAEQMNMSLSTLKRKFEQSYQCTPHKWMNERKLAKASTLLSTTKYSITDICFICGFNSMSTFMLLFKKKYGVSPGQYRKQLE